MEHDCECESPVYDNNNRCKACGGVEPFERPAPPDSLERWAAEAPQEDSLQEWTEDALALIRIMGGMGMPKAVALLARARALGVGRQ